MKIIKNSADSFSKIEEKEDRISLKDLKKQLSQQQKENEDIQEFNEWIEKQPKKFKQYLQPVPLFVTNDLEELIDQLGGM
jgi:hypothetical protein